MKKPNAQSIAKSVTQTINKDIQGDDMNNATTKTEGAWAWTKHTTADLLAKAKHAFLWLHVRLNDALLWLGMDTDNAWDTKYRSFLKYLSTYKNLPIWKKCTKFVIDSFLHVSYQAYALLGSMICFLVVFA